MASRVTPTLPVPDRLRPHAGDRHTGQAYGRRARNCQNGRSSHLPRGPLCCFVDARTVQVGCSPEPGSDRRGHGEGARSRSVGQPAAVRGRDGGRCDIGEPCHWGPVHDVPPEFRTARRRVYSICDCEN